MIAKLARHEIQSPEFVFCFVLFLSEPDRADFLLVGMARAAGADEALFLLVLARPMGCAAFCGRQFAPQWPAKTGISDRFDPPCVPFSPTNPIE